MTQLRAQSRNCTGFPIELKAPMTVAKIVKNAYICFSEAEFDEIGRSYPNEISADRATAEVFRNKYVDRHPVILEGWNRLR